MSAIGDAFVTIRPDASKFAGETEGFFKANAAKFALIGTGIGAAVAVGFTALKLGESFDAAFDTIRLGTGATGEALKGLEADFKGVFKSVPTDAETASTAIADLNTRLGLTGEPLQEMATQFINLSRITGTDLGANIADLTRVFGDWSVASDEQAGVMDAVFRASQASGIGINQLAQKVVQFGAPLRQMGFGLDESIALLSKWEKEGVNGELVLGSLRIAMGKFARDNVPMREGLDQTAASIQEMGPGAESTALAMEVFGARAGPDMAAAILEGRFAIDDYLAAVNDGTDTISGAAADTDDWRERLTVLKNQALVGLEPVLTALFNGMGALAEVISTRLVPAFQAHVLPVLQAFAGFLSDKDVEPRAGVTVEMIDLRRAGELMQDLGRLWDHPGVTGETKKQFIEEAFERIEIDELGIRAVQFAENLVPLAAVSRWWEMERGTGFEPATLCLGSRCSAS